MPERQAVQHSFSDLSDRLVLIQKGEYALESLDRLLTPVLGFE